MWLLSIFIGDFPKSWHLHHTFYFSAAPSMYGIDAVLRLEKENMDSHSSAAPQE